jgi:hypothetical protein
MLKPRTIFLLGPFVFPVLIHAAYLAATASATTDEIWQVDVAVFLACLASGSACLVRATDDTPNSERIALVCLYLVMYGAILCLFRDQVCQHWDLREYGEREWVSDLVS